MIQQKDNIFWHKFNAIFRYSLEHLATNIFPMYVVNEYPKSGGSWVAEMLSEALGVPFPRNRLPMLRSSILHGHMMQSWNMHNILIVWRDGRDVLISLYFHSLFQNDIGNALLVKACQRELNFQDYNDIQANLSRFMEYVFERKQHPKISWVDFVNKWGNCECCEHVKYEDLRANPVEELQRVVISLSGNKITQQAAEKTVDKFSFKKMAGRKPGDEKKQSFLRKGIVGDWKNYFSNEHKQLFNSYAGNALIKTGYEVDDSWVTNK